MTHMRMRVRVRVQSVVCITVYSYFVAVTSDMDGVVMSNDQQQTGEEASKVSAKSGVKRKHSEASSSSASSAPTDRKVRSSTRDKTLEGHYNRRKEEKEKARRRVSTQHKQYIVNLICVCYMQAERSKRSKHYTVRKLTQEELLEEAKITEEYNLASLQILQAMEEEKKKLPPPKAAYEGPQIRFLSKEGKTTITFTNVDTIPQFINSKVPPCKLSSSFNFLFFY